MLTMFPGERPEYTHSAEPEELFVQSALFLGRKQVTCVTRLYLHGIRYDGRAKCGIPEEDTLRKDRALQKIVKLSFYKAAVKGTGQSPPWGSLTGIRPGKLVSSLLESGKSEACAKRMMERQYCVSPGRAELCLDTARAGLSVKKALLPLDICLYIGIPFCPSRCAYCSFVSNSVEKSMHLVEPFLAALEREIWAVAKVIEKLKLRVISVYIGGGTPTILTAKQLAALMKNLQTAIDLSGVREYTVEAGRPDTVTEEKLAQLIRLGATRISINPQSMAQSVLEAIGRPHTAEDVEKALALARKAGFRCINMDLIGGLPNDTEPGFQNTLDRVLLLAPENITVHTLSLKKGSKIMLEKQALPTPDQVKRFLDYANFRLRGAGYLPYYLYRQKYISGGFENVGWSKSGFFSLYNICIMEELNSILSLGGGGTTKLVAGEIGKISRLFNAKYPYEYIHGIDRIIEGKKSIEDFYHNEVLTRAT